LTAPANITTQGAKLMYDYQRDDYKVLSYIKRNIPQHEKGFRRGWLKLEEVDSYNAIHIYSKINGSWKIIGTVL